MADIKELQVKMAEAIANNDVVAMEAIAGEITKGKSDRHKQEVEAQRKEAEAMAGDREKLAVELWAYTVKMPGLKDKLTALKATGFTFSLDNAETQYKSVALKVPAVGKAKASGGNGGGAGKTKDEFGMSLQEVYDKFKTDEDEVKLAEAQVKDEEASAKLGKTTNSNAWRVKNEVKKRVIASGELTPAK